VEEYTPEMLAMLERQREHFSSDEMLEERAALWRDATPQECLAALAESCAEAAAFLSRYPPDLLEKVARARAAPARYRRAPGAAMAEPGSLSALTVAKRIAERLDEDGLPYGIGGALALGAWGAVRATKTWT
jgi:hypothetical protein